MAEQGIKEIKIDNTQYLIEPTIYTAVSQTSASATFTAALTNFQLFDGVLVAVKFNETNNTNNATLNINSTGAKAIYYNNAKITANQLKANHTYTLSYVKTLNSNNGGWELIGDLNTDTTVSNAWSVASNDTTKKIPMISTTVNGVTGTAVAIPEASTSAGGIVTIGTQNFGGSKTFTGDSFEIRADTIRLRNKANSNNAATNQPYVTSLVIGDGRYINFTEYKDDHLVINSKSILLDTTSNGISAYDSTKTYSLNTIVWYDRSYYYCSTAITEAEAWNSAHWTAMPASNIMANASFMPWKNNSYALGSSSYRWSKVYIGAENSYGNDTTPIYWNNGVPKACTSYANASVNYATSAGSANSATTATYSTYPKIVASNEIRFDVNTKPSSATDLHIGYAWSDGSKDAKINGYRFDNGNGSNLAKVYASEFVGSLNGNASTATTSTWTTLLKPINTATTASASTWNIPSGSYQVWGERFSDTRLKYTPSGGSESTVTDTGDWTMWLTSGGTTNTATLNMRIDGTYYGSFSGNLTGNATTATKTNLLAANAAENTTGLQYCSAQLTIGSADGNAYDGSSSNSKLWSYPADYTGHTTVANIQTIRMYWDGSYWHDIFASPNNENLLHRSVLSGSAKGWRLILDSANYSSYAVAKTAGVTAVTWDATNKKLTRTINGTAADVMTAAQMSTALGLGTMASETATNYLKWQTTSSASTALYNFGVYVAQNTAAGTGPNGNNYYSLINIPYRKASSNSKLDYGWQLGNTADNDNRLYYRTIGDNTAGNWQTIAHVTTSSNNTGSARQPVYMTSTGTITTANYTVAHFGNAGKSNMNDIGRLHASTGMTQLADPGNNNDNPMNGSTKSTGWHLYWDTNYTDDPNGSNSWAAQITNKAGTSQWWVRSRNGGTITNGTAWASNWRHLVTSTEAAVGSTTKPIYINDDGEATVSLPVFVQHSTIINNTTDWNGLMIPGCYKVQMSAWGDAATYHSPNEAQSDLYSFGLLFVMRGAENDGEKRTLQIYFPHRSDAAHPIYCRMANGSGPAWQTWHRLTRDTLQLKGGTLTGALTLTSQSSAFNDKNILFSSGGRIGGNTSGDIGIYGKGAVYIKPNSNTAASADDGVVLDADGLRPYKNNDYSLGTSTNEWSAVYTPLLAAGSDSLTIKVGTASTTFTVAKFQGSSFLPGTTSARYIGSATAPWTNIYATTFTGTLSGNATSASKISATLNQTTKTYLLGTTTTITATAANVSLTGDTGVYLTATPGELSAYRYSWHYGTTEHAYTLWNDTDQSIDFIFI